DGIRARNVTGVQTCALPIFGWYQVGDIARDVANLVPANKNIGTTHITNGAYRLHPVEWSIGEAVGALAEICHRHNVDPVDVRSRSEERRGGKGCESQRLQDR